MARVIIQISIVLLTLYSFAVKADVSKPPLPQPTRKCVENMKFIPSPIAYIVKVSVYEPLIAQCDSFPNETADGTHFLPRKAGSYRYCALSRDLLERWGGPFAFGDTIHLKGIKAFSGGWIVKDTMSSRWNNKVDLLVDVGTYPHTFENVEMRFAHGLENLRR